MILLAVMFGNMIDSLSVGHSPVYVCTHRHRHRRGAGAVATGRDASSCTYGSNLELSCSESGVTVSVPFVSDDRSSAATSESGEKHHHTYSPVCDFERVVRRRHGGMSMRDTLSVDRRLIHWATGPLLYESCTHGDRHAMRPSGHSRRRLRSTLTGQHGDG